MGSAIALPMLEAMMPLTALAVSAPKAPVRMAFLFVPNGMSMDAWRPATAGALTDLPPLLSPLNPVRNQLNILSGLAQRHAEANGDGPGDHARSTAAWLTGCQPKKTNGSDIYVGVSADQLAAQQRGHLTQFASLELGCERGAQSGDCDSGYSCAYSSSVSWSSSTSPVAKEINPRLVFERLFGSADQGPEAQARRRALRASVLDYASAEATALESKLGQRDRHKLQEYLAAVREIEIRMERFEQTQASRAQVGPTPAGIPGDFGEHIRLMGDMMILAFQSDLTRIATLMFANEGSNRAYPMIGVSDGHHEMSHHGKDPHRLEAKRRIDEFHVAQLAYVLNKMQSIREGDSTLLDNTLLVYGGGISDGDRHNHDDLPILLAGKGGSSLKGGRHLQFVPGTPMTNLFVSMLSRFGANMDKIGDSTGPLRELL